MVSGRWTRRDTKRVKRPFKSDVRRHIIFKSEASGFEKEEIQLWQICHLSLVTEFMQPFQYACKLHFLQYIDSLCRWLPIPAFILLLSSPWDWNSVSILLLFLQLPVCIAFFSHDGNRVFSFCLRQPESLLSSQPGVGTWWREAIWTTTSTGLKANSARRCVRFWPVTFDIIPVLVLLATNHRFQWCSATCWMFWFFFFALVCKMCPVNCRPPHLPAATQQTSIELGLQHILCTPAPF